MRTLCVSVSLCQILAFSLQAAVTGTVINATTGKPQAGATVALNKLGQQNGIELRDLQQKLGFTAVYVTHDQEEAFALSDVMAVMDRGRIVEVGRHEDLLARSGSLYARLYELQLLECRKPGDKLVTPVAVAQDGRRGRGESE